MTDTVEREFSAKLFTLWRCDSLLEFWTYLKALMPSTNKKWTPKSKSDQPARYLKLSMNVKVTNKHNRNQNSRQLWKNILNSLTRTGCEVSSLQCWGVTEYDPNPTTFIDSESAIFNSFCTFIIQLQKCKRLSGTSQLKYVGGQDLSYRGENV